MLEAWPRRVAEAGGGTAAVITGFEFAYPVFDDTVVIRD